jgi:hypothetical protein
MEYCQARGLTDEILTPVNGQLLTLDQACKLEGIGRGIFHYKNEGAVGAYVFPISKTDYKARLIYDPDRIDPVPKVGEGKRKQQKYWRAKNSVNILYKPPHLTDWDDTKASYDLIFVEAELGSVRLAASGFHAVACGGVFNYHLGGKHTKVIPELERLVTSKQVARIIVMFDSDASDPDVKRDLWNGMHKFCQDMMKLRPDRKNTVFISFPPHKDNGEKNGPDDYLNEMGIDEFRQLLNRSEQYSDLPALQIESRVLNRFIYDELSGQVFDEETRVLIKAEHANQIMRTFGEFDDIMSNRPKRSVFTVDRMLTCEGVRLSRGQQYNPATDQIYFEDTLSVPSVWKINKFNPADVPEAVKGDVSIVFKVLNSICRDDLGAVPKILTIAAYHAQNPALTPKYGLLFAGEQGAGKSLMARLIGLALSKKFSSSKVKLDADFNSLWRGFACREWEEFDRNMDEEWLKSLITGETYEVNQKYGGMYTERNHTLNIFTCNGLQSKLQEGDRRFVVAGYAKSDDKLLGLEFEAWVNGPGPSYFRHYLLNEVDASGYHLLDPKTKLKDNVIEASKSLRATLKDILIEDWSSVEGLECMPNDIAQHFLAPHRITPEQFNKQYGQYFTKPARESVKINGVPKRFRAFRNHDRWATENNTEAYQKQYKLAHDYLTLVVKQGGLQKF